MNLFEVLKKNAIKFPTKEALIIDEFNLTYKDLFDKVVKTILVFKKNNINKKSTIVIIEDNSLSHILSIFSLAYLGSKVIPLSSQYSKDWMLNKFKKIKVEALGFGPFTASYSLLYPYLKYLPLLSQICLLLAYILDSFIQVFVKTDLKEIFPVGYFFIAKK